MKITRVLSAAVLAGTVLVSTTACFNKEDAANTTPSAEIGVTATATPSATPSATASTEEVTEAPVVEETEDVSPEETEEAPVAEKQGEPVSNGNAPENIDTEVPAILAVVNGFYDFTEKEDSLDNLMDAGQSIQQKDALTADEAKALVAAAPDAFKYFDTSTPENVRNAYNELTATAMGVKTAGTAVTFNVSVEAVDYNGETAAVDKNSVEVSIGGEIQPVFPGEGNNLNLSKKSGKWLIVASPNGR